MSEIPKSERLTEVAERQRKWLDAAVAYSGMSLTQIARTAKIAPTILTRFRNDPDHVGTLSFATIMAVADASGAETTPEILGSSAATPRRVLREPEAAPYEIETGGEISRAVAAMVGNAGHLLPWELKTRALEQEGYLPGDILILDLNAVATSGDIVCAQIYDWTNPSATQTVWRIYEAPFLIAATSAPDMRKPLLVDQDKVMIKGVVVAMIRPPRHRSA